jgi:3-mercaptopyruvate sulfurtransferase SseA
LDVPIGAKVEGTLGEALDAEKRVVYCGSGVAACVKFFSLALIGKNNVTL